MQAMRNPMSWGSLMMSTLLVALSISTPPGLSQSTAPGDNTKKATKKAGKSAAETPPPTDVVTSIPFGETNDKKPFNASGAVDIGGGQFLLCDNKIPNQLLELRLDEQGKKVGPIVRRPLSGVDPSAVKDLEGMTMVERNGDRFIVATSSFNRLSTTQGKKMVPLEGYAG